MSIESVDRQGKMSAQPSSTSASALAALAIGSAIAGAVAYASFMTLTEKGSSKSSSLDGAETSANSSRMTTLPKEIRDEQLSRNSLYFGQDGMEKIHRSRIAVIGLGGVGSHTAHMLARSGVGYLRLIDFDQVTLSSLNRHACATLDDVGTPKVDALKKFLEKICPDRSYLEIDSRVQMYTGDSAKDGTLLDGEWDLIIDAIDDVPTKANLIAHCVRSGIRVISCQGAGGKSDFTRLHVSDLRSASRDPLASKLRQTIKKKLKNDKTIKDDSYLDDHERVSVIYSSEKVVSKLAEFTEEQKEEGVHKFGAVDSMRIRVLPVLGTMPAIMGQALAALALCDIGDKPFSPVAGERIGRNVRNRLYQHFARREKSLRDAIEGSNGENAAEKNRKKEEKAGGSGNKGNPNLDFRPAAVIDGKWMGRPQIDDDDVEYLLEVWRNKCAVTNARLGTILELIRWDTSKPSDCSNIVLMGKSAFQKFDECAKNGGDGRDSIPADVRKKIIARLATCRSE